MKGNRCNFDEFKFNDNNDFNTYKRCKKYIFPCLHQTVTY